MVTDPIADFLTRIRNAQLAGHAIVDIPASNMKKKLTEILHENGYILKYRFDEDGPQGTIKIALKYNPETKKYDYSRINWEEFFNVIKGNGFMNRERLRDRNKAHNEGLWVREAAEAYSKKHSSNNK